MGAVRIVEMLYCTSLLCVVGAGEQPELSPRRLKVLNTSNHTCIADLTFVSTILAVRLNRACLVVVEERRAVVHELGTLCVHRTIDTVANPRGVCALSANEDSSLLALPSSTSSGTVVVHDCVNLHVVCEVPAHKSPLAAVSLTPDGALLATASEKGTVIRVHCLPQAAKVYSFRRGTLSATIRSLAFLRPPSAGASLLAASSVKGTVHVFRVEGEAKDVAPKPSGIGPMRLIGGLLGKGVAKRVTDTLQPQRDCASVHLPKPTVRAAGGNSTGVGAEFGIGGVCALRANPAGRSVGARPTGAEEVFRGAGAEDDGSAEDFFSAGPDRLENVQVVAVNADGLMCEFSVDLRTGESALERECSLAGGDGDGVDGHRAEAAGARWIGGGDVNGGVGGRSGSGGQVDLSASMSMSMGQSMFMARP